MEYAQNFNMLLGRLGKPATYHSVSYTHLRAHETRHDLVCRLLLLMFSSDLPFAIKGTRISLRKQDDFVGFDPKHQKLDKWTIAGEKRQTCWPKLHIETEYESQLTAIR